MNATNKLPTDILLDVHVWLRSIIVPITLASTVCESHGHTETAKALRGIADECAQYSVVTKTASRGEL